MSITERSRHAAAVTCLALALGAAAASCQSGPPDGTAAGIFIRVGGPAPGAPFPLPGNVTATPANGGSPVTVSVGTDGRFRISLPPGSYRFTATSPLMQSGKMTCSAAQPATIRSGKTTTGIKVICSIP